MKIMPIMTNKNDCLQKKQSNPHTPSFNARVVVSGLHQDRQKSLSIFNYYISVAKEAFRKFTKATKASKEETTIAVLPQELKQMKGKLLGDGSVSCNFPRRLIPDMAKAMKIMRQQYPEAKMVFRKKAVYK